MASSAYTAQRTSSDAEYASDRPLPPIPDSDLDLYSAGDESGRQRSISQPEASSVVGEQHQSLQSLGESSHSTSTNMNVEASSLRPTVHDAKSSGENSMASPQDQITHQNEFTSHLSRLRSASSPAENNRYQSSSLQSTRSSGLQRHAHYDMNNMPFPGSSSEQPPSGRRVQQVQIMPGTANYNIQRIRSNPQYRFIGDRVVLPRWQPDSEVSACPICNSLFNLFNRKHHCRKCGKVVCASCSPHRITIPREYIVKPESEIQDPQSRNPRTSNASILAAVPGDSGIEGGERVRLCNPCVPDPNTAPPQAPPPPYTSGLNLSNEHRVDPEDRLPMFSAYRAPPNSAQLPPRGPRPDSMSNDIVNYLQDLEIRERNNTRRPQLEWARPNPESSIFNGLRRHSQLPERYRDTSQRSVPVSSGPMQAPGNNMNSFFRHPEPPVLAALMSNTSTTPTGRRNIPEDDLCPVCGCMYSDQMKADEAQKELHVQRCINDLSSRNRSNSQVGAGSPEGQIESQSSAHMRRGMTKYTATARDAVGGEECQICLEDFLPSQELVRLTCLCRYHSECILSWWTQGQFGKCPTHDHGL